jgi:hypothetical protein
MRTIQRFHALAPALESNLKIRSIKEELNI